MGTGAEVSPEAECEMVASEVVEVAVEPKRVGVIEDLGVTVGRAIGRHHLGPLGDRDPVEFELPGVRPIQTEDRRIETQALLDGEITVSDLIYVGNVMDRYIRLLAAAGKSY